MEIAETVPSPSPVERLPQKQPCLPSDPRPPASRTATEQISVVEATPPAELCYGGPGELLMCVCVCVCVCVHT